ncbi:hypothetical protein 000TH008_12 [Bacillus phage 000TH008]|nr:hypothetical protein 000TH008_12 [Bacillus phage 000TH008]QQO40706.1 hypothetical protein 000TH009_12 [Bacillus phage 000TH009]
MNIKCKQILFTIIVALLMPPVVTLILIGAYDYSLITLILVLLAGVLPGIIILFDDL